MKFCKDCKFMTLRRIEFSLQERYGPMSEVAGCTKSQDKWFPDFCVGGEEDTMRSCRTMREDSATIPPGMAYCGPDALLWEPK